VGRAAAGLPGVSGAGRGEYAGAPPTAAAAGSLREVRRSGAGGVLVCGLPAETTGHLRAVQPAAAGGMTWDDHKDAYVLESGRELRVPDGILGMSPGASIWAGGDCTINTRLLTPQDRQDIAKYVIAQWRTWASIL
jgi:hypothetical protein